MQGFYRGNIIKNGENQVRLGALTGCDARLSLRKEGTEVGGSVLVHAAI